MSVTIRIELSEEARETLRTVKALPDSVLIGIAKAFDYENQLTVSHIVKDYLSFPKSGPSVAIGLRVQTGRGRASVRASKAAISGQSVVSAIGSNVGYMAAHEFGASVPAHDVVPKNAKALRFKIGQRVIFAKKVRIPAFDLPARAPIATGIEDRTDAYGDAISAEVEKAWGGKA